MKKATCLMLAALAVAGCAHEGRWIKTGNTAADSSGDQRECNNEAARTAMVNRSIGSTEPGNTQYDHFRRCMRARGYQFTREK